MLKHILCASALFLIVVSANAQNWSNSLPVGVRFAATEANSPPGSCGCFRLLGGAVDTSFPLGKQISVAVEFAGNHTANMPGTQRGLSTLSLMGGPRYTLALARRHAIFGQALFGAARGFDADFRSGNRLADTATVFTYHFGAAYEWAATPVITVRPAQIALVQTDLPNGTSNTQRNLQFGAGVVFRIRIPLLQR